MSLATQHREHDRSEVISALLREEPFFPQEPKDIQETGLSEPFIETLICKHVLVVGTVSGRTIADRIGLPFGVIEPSLQRLRGHQILVHRGSAPLNDYVYALTEQGRESTQAQYNACSYHGPAPVPLTDYIASVEAQTITAERPKRPQLEKAFADISVDPNLFARLGPAINSGTGMFLYGSPGNGKTTLAERVTRCFGHAVWIPYAIIAEGEVIKLFDPAYHVPVETSRRSEILQDSFDRRWVKIRRPTVIVGGELTMDNLEIRHNPVSRISEAPLQLKSNSGTLLIDDFGRQRMDPFELLNRWIIPLEKRYDFLTLGNGKKIQVPFDQLIIFSTNLEPKDLVDEAFLRRIPYKINVPDPSEQEFHDLFIWYADVMGCEYSREAVDYLLEKHYRHAKRSLRRCHPRDLLQQIHDWCSYNDRPMAMTHEALDLAVENYFTE